MIVALATFGIILILNKNSASIKKVVHKYLFAAHSVN